MTKRLHHLSCLVLVLFGLALMPLAASWTTFVEDKPLVAANAIMASYYEGSAAGGSSAENAHAGCVLSLGHCLNAVVRTFSDEGVSSFASDVSLTSRPDAQPDAAAPATEPPPPRA